ncbi:MAG: TonB-dependent receptor [Alphaproteobacteria bacterium]|jgi:iron complex outermembrane receptor protein|nr:TonB-dependent receptor [Alphaproteobacteria bacterium]
MKKFAFEMGGARMANRFAMGLLVSTSAFALTAGVTLAADAPKAKAKPVEVATSEATKTEVTKVAQATTPAPATAPAPADDADTTATGDERVERVVVTANKRKERLVDVPASVSVTTSTDLKNKSTYNVTELGEKMPNVNAGGSYSASFTIRGITSGTSGSGFAPAMGVNVDDVFMARDRSFDTGVADVERIEVLRGPQGTLYGKNTIAGIMNITTKRPTNDYEFLGDVSIGNENLFQARGTISGPIVEDVLLVRATGFMRQRDGYIFNTTLGKDVNELNNYGGRFMAVFNPSENFTIELRGDYFKQDEDGNTLETVKTATLPFPPLNTVPPQNPYDRVVNHNTDGFLYREVKGTSIKAEYDWDGYLFTSVSAWRKQDSDQNQDNDGGPTDGFDTGRAEGIDRFSQEVRITSPDEGMFTWIVGAYFDDETDDNLYHIHVGQGFPQPGLPVGFSEKAETISKIDSSSWSVFGSGKLKFTDQLWLQAGLRYTDEEKDLFYKQGPTQVVFGLVNAFSFPFTNIYPNGFNNTYSDDAVSGDVSLSYAFTNERVGYIKYSHGYKAGGFQSDVISPPLPFPVGPGITPDLSFKPETLDAYEVGFKASWFDSTVTTNMAVFYYDFINKQEQVNTGTSFRVSNAASATSQGAELELYWYPTDNLTMWGNVGYLDATYESFPNGGGVGINFDGNRLAGASKWSSSLGANYVTPFDMITGTNFYLSGDMDYRSSQYTDPNNLEALKVKAYAIFNARIGIEEADGGWGVYAFGRNLGDNTVLGGGVSVLGLYETRSINFGRSYGLEMRFHF